MTRLIAALLLTVCVLACAPDDPKPAAPREIATQTDTLPSVETPVDSSAAVGTAVLHPPSEKAALPQVKTGAGAREQAVTAPTTVSSRNGTRALGQ